MSARAAVAPGDVAAAVAAALGDDRLLPDPGELEVDGQPAEVVAAPRSLDELAELMRLAHGKGWAVVPAGIGTWLDAGNPLDRADLVVTTRRLDGILEHSPADLVVSAQAGVRLDSLAERLSEHRQRWALDPPGGGTVGATISTASVGPLATGYGGPRDLTLGLTVVRADGTIVRVGGRVVKNVTGYNLVRLFTGSWGTLGVIAEAHLRLHPVPAVDRTRVFRADRPGPLVALVRELGDGRTLPPAAAEVLSPAAGGGMAIEANDWQAAVRWLGHESSVEDALTAADQAGERHGLRGEDGPRLWRSLAGIEAAIRPRLVVRATAWTGSTGTLIELARSFGGAQTPAVVAAPLLGRVWILVSPGLYDGAGGERVWELRVRELRRALAERGGHVRIERAPEPLRKIVNAWHDPGPTLRLHEEIRRRFDPKEILNPGRFVRDREVG